MSNHSFDVATNKKKSKGNHQESTKDKEVDESPKLTFAQMEGNVSVAENEVINLPNVIITADPRKKGQ